MVYTLLGRPIRTDLVYLTIDQGIVIALFFQCVGALLNPANHMRKGTKWALFTHSVAIFSFATIGHTINRDFLSISSVDNREFSGTHEIPPGPFGYQVYATSLRPVSFLFYVMTFPLTQWLADGLLVGPAP
jgi:hypothetical protein